MARRISFWLILQVGFLLSFVASGQPVVKVERVFEGIELERPIAVRAIPDQPGHYLIAEQPGRIHLVDISFPTAHTVILDLTASLPNYADRGRDQLGLLDIALHPDFAQNHQLFLHYTASRPRRNVISRWTVGEGGQVDPDSEVVLLEQRQPYATNNGGGLVFGPDGYLYIGIGDGGAQADPRNGAQRLDTLLGKVLRIDVDGGSREGKPYTVPGDNPFVETHLPGNPGVPGSLPGLPGERGEIFAYGLSNPWRFSFDRKTGDLWLGDVGESSWEEINQIQNGGNYGWRHREGSHNFSSLLPKAPKNFIDPVYEYPHSEGKAIVGGYVYRGGAIPELVGHYIYADYTTGKVWALEIDDNGKAKTNRHLMTLDRPASFAEEPNGEILICCFEREENDEQTGRIYRLIAK